MRFDALLSFFGYRAVKIQGRKSMLAEPEKALALARTVSDPAQRLNLLRENLCLAIIGT